MCRSNTTAAERTQGHPRDTTPTLSGESFANSPTPSGLSRTDGLGVRPRVPRLLPIWDGAASAAALSAAGWVSVHDSIGGEGPPIGLVSASALTLVLLTPPALSLAGAYNHRRRRAGSRLLLGGRLWLAAVAIVWLTTLLAIGQGVSPSHVQLGLITLLAPCGWLLGRAIYDRSCHRADGMPERVLIVAPPDLAMHLAHGLRRREGEGTTVVGRLDQSSQEQLDLGAIPHLGQPEDLLRAAMRYRVQRAIVYAGQSLSTELSEQIRVLSSRGVWVDLVPAGFDLVGPSPATGYLGIVPVVHVEPVGLSTGQRAAKRTLDVLLAGSLLAASTPVLLIAMLAVRTLDGPGVLFRQQRAGREGRPFTILKLRTMRHDADDRGVALLVRRADRGEGMDSLGPIAETVAALKNASDDRVTRVGRILRATSIDELPQLLNVLRGDMSMVGPRPLRPFEVASLSDRQRTRMHLRPGLTGLWQVMGRSNISWDERMELDRSYVAHWSLVGDLRIIARTPMAILTREGAE